MLTIEIAAHFINQSLTTGEPSFASYTDALSQELMGLASDATSPSDGVEWFIGTLNGQSWEVWLVPVERVS